VGIVIQRSLWLVLGHVLLAAAGKAPVATLQTIQAPQNFQGEALSETEIRWSWDPVLGSSTQLGATRYELRADPGDALIATIAASPVGPISYTESVLTPATEYARYVVAANGETTARTASLFVSTMAEPLAPPCTLRGSGGTIVMAPSPGKKRPGGKTKVVFRADPPEGEFILPPVNGAPKNINVKVVEQIGNSQVTVEVEGLKESKKAGDAQFSVSYRCKDNTPKTVLWSMTVVGDDDGKLACTVVAIPPEPAFVPVAIENNFRFAVFGGSPGTMKSVWTDVSDNGGTPQNGDVITTPVDPLPFEGDQVRVIAKGNAESKKDYDVIVQGSVQCTATIAPGEVIVGTATGYRQYTVIPSTGGTEPMCSWQTSGPQVVSLPRGGKNETFDIVFEGIVHGAAKFQWTTVDPANLPGGVRAVILGSAGSERLTVQIIVTPAAVQSSTNGFAYVQANYICEEDGKTRSGTAIHQLTVANLGVKK
jgi:hypothetical protein